MCDLEPCMDSYLTILNIDIPDILKRSNNYVVKGGRSFDYYAYEANGQKMVHLTDWDVACTPSAIDPLKNQILESLRRRHNLNFIEQIIVLPDNTKGIQIGFECASNKCYFIDLVPYDADDPIFANIVMHEDVKYINREYMLHDLRETYNNRRDDIINHISSFGVDVSRMTLNDFSYDYKIVEEEIKQSLEQSRDNQIQNLMNDCNRRIELRRRKNPDVDVTELKNECDEDVAEVKSKFEKDASLLREDTLPELKERLLKLYRTKMRYDILNPTGGKRKRRRTTKRNNKRKTKQTIRRSR